MPQGNPLRFKFNPKRFKRKSPYWNILEFCRHIGIARLPSGRCNWMARVRRINGSYRQTTLGQAVVVHESGLDYGQALQLARVWFNRPEIKAIASTPYPVGVNQQLRYTKSVKQFTVGDAMQAFVEWKRVAATRTYFETSLSLINHHIIPRLGNLPVDQLDRAVFTKFCVDLLETAPKRGNQGPTPKIALASLDHESLRKRKKTLNTVIGLLRTAIEMAWENGDVESERAWRKLHRVPHADVPRQLFLTRHQVKKLIANSRPDLAMLVQAALYTGCRVTELANLRVRDVGVHVFGIYVSPLKSLRGRYVILPNEGMSFFLDQTRDLEEESLVFRTLTGKPWTGGRHKHLLRDAVRSAGIPDGFVFHGLRHTYASQLVQAGTPLAVVAKQLGHSNTDTVSRTYGHLSCECIETEIETRFAPLRERKADPRLDGLKNSLQICTEPKWSWPLRNNSKVGGDLLKLLRGIEAPS